MTKPKRPRDPNQLAKLITDIATGQNADEKPKESPMSKLGRAGGQRGGVARARTLSPERRAEIAKAAAAARWDSKDGRGGDSE